jgi:hypothetical protein
MRDWPAGAFYLYGEMIKKIKKIDYQVAKENILKLSEPFHYFVFDPLNQNLYNYVRSNPIIFSDLYGLLKCDNRCLNLCIGLSLGPMAIVIGGSIVGCILTFPCPWMCIEGIMLGFEQVVPPVVLGCIAGCCKKDVCVKCP